MLTRRACALAALVLLTGCGIRPESEPRALGSDAPSPLVASPTASPGPSGQSQQQLFFVREDMLVVVPRPAAVVSPERALSDLVAGPTEAENAAGLTSALPGTGELVLLEVVDGTAVVEITGTLEGGNNQVLALAQVVATLDASPGVDDVRFVQDGTPLQVPRDDGALTDLPVSLEDYRDLLAG